MREFSYLLSVSQSGFPAMITFVLRLISLSRRSYSWIRSTCPLRKCFIHHLSIASQTTQVVVTMTPLVTTCHCADFSALTRVVTKRIYGHYTCRNGYPGPENQMHIYTSLSFPLLRQLDHEGLYFILFFWCLLQYCHRPHCQFNTSRLIIRFIYSMTSGFSSSLRV